MDRRRFLQGVAATGIAAPVLAQAAEADVKQAGGLEKRALARTGETLSIIGFGGLVVNGVAPQDAANYVAEAFERGVNYFDVAPAYGNAQQILGPALKPYRDRVFLACKTKVRDAKGAQAELENSLRLAQTDHFDLYQLHHLKTKEDAEKAFAPGGAIEVLIKAREQGKARLLGFSAHSEEAALTAMDHFDFDTILFPINFAMWMKNDFGPKVVKRAQEKKMGILAIKAGAHQSWAGNTNRAQHKWRKMWYEPLDDAGRLALSLRFTLGQPVTAAVPPGQWDLFKKGLEVASSGIAPLTEAEAGQLKELAMASNPIFPMHEA